MRPTALSATSPLYYVESGDGGDPIVLLHGLGTDGRIWDDVRTHLSRWFRLFTPDLPGHGKTPLPARDLTLETYTAQVIRWLDALCIGPVHLIGHSLGGAVGVSLALRRPDLVRSMGLVSPVRLSDQPVPKTVARTYTLYRVAQSVGVPSPGVARVFLERGLGVSRSAATDDLTERWRESSQTARRAMALALREWRQSEPELGGRLGQVRCPVCILWSLEDPLFPGREAAAEVARRLNGAQNSFIEAGGLPMVERPDEFWDWVVQYLKQQI